MKKKKLKKEKKKKTKKKSVTIKNTNRKSLISLPKRTSS